MNDAQPSTIPFARTVVVTEFPGEPYRVLEPVSVEIECTGLEFHARFVEANIAMAGDSPQDALSNLLADVLDTFEDYVASENKLGREPARQLAVLRRHLAKA